MDLNTYETLVAASLVLLLGRKLVAGVTLLNRFSIPEPVAGGMLVACALLAVRETTGAEVRFDLTMQTPLMLTFFATLGLSADLATLRKGGRSIAIFLSLVVGLLLLQNAIGIAMASSFGLHPSIGLLIGSVALAGGHGTAAAWSPVFTERFGLAAATELAMACATFGLVLGGLLGGPVARLLLRRVEAPARASGADGPLNFEEPTAVRLITPPALIEILALVLICLLLGQAAAARLGDTWLALPPFVWVLFVGVVLRNGLAALRWHAVFDRAVSVLGNVSLSMFLAMALMSLRMWELAALALPLVAILAVQTVAMALYAVFVTYPVMGRNYDAVVLAAGHCGIGLGATPTAIANMQAVTDRFGPSHLAFLVVPMVGAFFMDIVNAIVIQICITWLAGSP